MGKVLLISSLYFLILSFFSGCLVRTYTIEKPRVDLEVTGNQGYLVGSPPPYKPKKKLSSTRKITVIEIELGKHPSQIPSEEIQEEAPIEEKETLKPEEGVAREELSAEKVILEEPGNSSASLEESPSSKEYRLYTVQKNDTLQKISYKFYKTTKKWKKIYEINKDILKAPDKIYPGQVLKIPRD